MKDLLVWALDHARQQTLGLVTDVPADRGCLRSAPGEQHPAWVLGHLLLGDTYLLALLGVEDLSDDFPALLRSYGPAAPPLPSIDRYDALPTLVDRLRSAGSRRLSAIGPLAFADLDRPTPDPALARAQPTIAHHLHSLVCHEGYHAGQLAAWRRTHGFPPTRWSFAPPQA
ncbi:MAG: DinB family protein [Gemmatimonadota bacterium]